VGTDAVCAPPTVKKAMQRMDWTDTLTKKA